MTDVIVRPMRESDQDEAALIVRLAFGTFLGLPEPEKQGMDRDYVLTRFKTAPEAALVAVVNDRLIGSNFATHWGSFGFFGPLTIRPEYWNQGIAQKLLAATMDLFDAWGVTEAGLFTFPQSAKHIALYQKFGFWARFLTAVMSKLVSSSAKADFHKFSELDDGERRSALNSCREITGMIMEGLDVSIEILAVHGQSLGETVLVEGGFAVCHCGPGTEAGNDKCYIKFAAVRPGPREQEIFHALLDACEALAAERRLSTIEAGVNLGRSAAYRYMLGRGFLTQMQGVAMHRRDKQAYNRPNVFVIDDWR